MSLGILQEIQNLSHPVLDTLFKLITLFGEQYLLAVVFCVLYWCVSKELGRYLLYALCATVSLNGLVKDLVGAARPIGEAGVVSKWLHTATGHSFPSGHSQCAATFWWSAARWAGRGWRLAGAALLIVAVGFSRLYLGLHYLEDVVAGILLGVLVGELYHWLMVRKRLAWLAVALLLALAAAAALTGSSEDTLSAVWLTCGVLCGSVLEQGFVRLRMPRGPLRGLMRLAAGFLVVGLAYLLPGLLPWALSGQLAIGLVGFACTGLAPWLFAKLRL